MVDLISGVSLFTKDNHGYTAYRPPKRFIDLGRTKFKRAIVKSACRKIGEVTHTSIRRTRNDVLPYLKHIAAKNTEDVSEYFDLSDDEAGLLVK